MTILWRQSSRAFASQTGTVKFYLRSKGYGFLIPDNGGAEIFVHRSGILSHVSMEESLQNPYLRQGERVRYEAIPDTGLDKAVQVTWVNGTHIPPLRRNYFGKLLERSKQELGQHCYDILSDPNTSEEEKWSKIKDAYLYADSLIQTGVLTIERFGMSLADFPTIPSSDNKPGMYQFANGKKSKDSDVSSSSSSSSSDHEAADWETDHPVKDDDDDHHQQVPGSK